MAEGEGFEPPVPFQAQRFSRPPVSTAHPSLREWERLSIHQFTAPLILSGKDLLHTGQAVGLDLCRPLDHRVTVHFK